MIMKNIIELKRKLENNTATIDDMAKVLLYLLNAELNNNLYTDTDVMDIHKIKDELNKKFGKFGSGI